MLQFRGSKSFAKWMLEGGRLLIKPDLSRIRICRGVVIEVVLFKEGSWQCELVVGLPGAVVPRHRHMLVDSCDLALGGCGAAEIEGVVVQQIQRGALRANFVRVPRGAWHGGTVGPEGAVWLSFQQWIGEAGWLADDWQEQS